MLFAMVNNSMLSAGFKGTIHKDTFTKHLLFEFCASKLQSFVLLILFTLPTRFHSCQANLQQTLISACCDHRLLLLKLDTQQCSHLLVEVCIERGMDHNSEGTDRIIVFQSVCPLAMVVHERGMFTVPHPLHASFTAEQAGRWCHQFACLVLTIEVYAATPISFVFIAQQHM